MVISPQKKSGLSFNIGVMADFHDSSLTHHLVNSIADLGGYNELCLIRCSQCRTGAPSLCTLGTFYITTDVISSSPFQYMSHLLRVAGWWFQPLWKYDGVRQLGWWHSHIWNGSHKIPWFQSTNQLEIDVLRGEEPDPIGAFLPVMGVPQSSSSCHDHESIEPTIQTWGPPQEGPSVGLCWL